MPMTETQTETQTKTTTTQRIALSFMLTTAIIVLGTFLFAAAWTLLTNAFGQENTNINSGVNTNANITVNAIEHDNSFQTK